MSIGVMSSRLSHSQDTFTCVSIGLCFASFGISDSSDRFFFSYHQYLNQFNPEVLQAGRLAERLWDENSAFLQNGMGLKTANPSWKRSLPHILVATITAFLYGYHLGVVNEPLESISFDLGFGGNTLAEGLVVSTCLAGAFVGSIFSGSIADGVGRCRALQLSTLPMIIGASMSATTNNLEGMLLGRFLVGTGMGLGPAVASLYVAEISPSFVRGTYGSFIQIATCLGLACALFIGIPAKEIVGWWRVCFWVSAIPAAILALAMVFCAESPHWLYKRGRCAEAEAEFEKLLGESHVKSAIAELSKLDRSDDVGAVKYSDLFRGRNFKVVFIGSTIYAFQQLSGINAVFYFSSTVFKKAGVPSDLANISVGVANFSGSIIAMVLMDKMGRKGLLLSSFMGMAGAMGLQVSSASSFLPGSAALFLSVGGMLLFVFTFAIGAGPVPGLLLAEIFPSRIRAKAMAVCLSVHWAVNFFVGLFFLRLLEKTKQGDRWTFGNVILTRCWPGLFAFLFLSIRTLRSEPSSHSFLISEQLSASCCSATSGSLTSRSTSSPLLLFWFCRMEENVIAEGNCKRSDNLSESRPNELDNAAEKNKADKCSHFSIRGYVAEVRKKDRKICWPFSTVGDDNKFEEQTLPPLHVPKFRWWGCENCLRQTDSKDTPIETGVYTNCCNKACETKAISSPGIPSTLSCGDSKRLHSGFQQSSEVNIVDVRKSSSDVSLYVNNDKHLPVSFGNKKEKGSEVVHAIVEGVNFTKEGKFSTDFQIGMKGCDLSSTDNATATSSKSHEKRALETTTLKSKGYELVPSYSEIFQKETETLKSKGDELVNSSKEIFHTEIPEFSRTNLAQINAGHRDAVTSSVISEVDKEASNAVVCPKKKLHSLVSVDSSSESDEKLAGEDVQDQHHASLRGNSGDTSHGSKPRKLCSLTDIIRREVLGTSNKLHYTERHAKTDHRKTEGAESKATPEASPGMSVYPVSNNQVAFQGTSEKVMLGKKKKCELPQDQIGGSSRMSRQRGGTENIIILKEDSKIKIMDTINANGELTGDASFLIDSHLSSKSFLDKHRNDKKLIPVSEKKEMSQVVDSLSSLALRQDGSSNKIEIRKDAKIKGVGSELVPIKSFQGAVAGIDLNLDPQIYVAPQQKGKKLALGKNKNKLLRVEREKSSIIPWQESMSHKDMIIQRNLDRRHKGAPSDILNSVQVPSTGKIVHRGLKRHMQIHRKDTLNKRRKNLPQVECRVTIPGSESVSSILICPPKASSNACNYENADDLRAPSKLSMDQCAQMANNMCEREASDDIPMEIVELMARNQYERRLYYAKDATENRYCFSETTEKDKDTGIMDSTETLGKEMLRLLHEKSNLQKSLSSNAKDGIGLGPSGGPTKQKSDACLSNVDGEYYSINFSTGRLEQGQASSGFKAFPRRQGKVPSQVPFPVVGSRRSCGTENCSWDGDLVGHSCFGTSVQSLGSYQTSQAIVQQSSITESQPIWSAVPCRIPFESNSPQKLVTELSIPNRLSQFPDPLPKGNVNWEHTPKLKASHLQKKKGCSEMETNKGAHSEYLFPCTGKGNVYQPRMRGPLDLYANETVSAMHLLRLMHAGVCPNTPVNRNNNRERFLKDPPFPHDQIINESSRPEASVSKTSGAVNLSSWDYHSKSHHLGKTCEHFPPVSVAKAVDSLIQKDVSFKRATVFTDGFLANALPGALKYQEMGDKKRSYSPARTRGPKLHTSASRNSHTSENHEFTIYNPQKGFLHLPASDSRQFHEQSQTAGGSTKHVELKVGRQHETVSPVERISGMESCTLNRNPADFTVPEAGNVYMIGARHLKRKLTPSRERGRPFKMDVHKRPKKLKLTTIKDHEQLYSLKNTRQDAVVPP
ncbi:hypothetical protein NE237_024660 [Protea cynaroides]|uniref:Major facilitator superfamily (MFS) profile domain-containing protein n=1 Tax=Protea cynaroides TaxID=273540 RepID=A0A9Q0H5L4_9MAGN|nr:hypothetical protein NE237_024660 [Protea cynaroides]